MRFKEEWLMPGAVVPVDAETTRLLVEEIKRVVGVAGELALVKAEYLKLADMHALALNQNNMQSSMAGAGAVFDFQERLADAIEAMPFGDTATSFAVYVRNFK